jgi:hypothetical protein
MLVKYRKGTTLGATDFMSRLRENPDGTFIVGVVQPGLVEGQEPAGVTKARAIVLLEGNLSPLDEFLGSRDFLAAQASCPWVSSLKAFVKEGVLPKDPKTARWAKSNEENLISQRGLLFRCTHCATGKGRLTRQINAILVPQPLRTRVLELAHTQPIYGHKGVLATYQLLRTSYYWPTMKGDTVIFVRRCSFCQGKHRHVNPVPLETSPFRIPPLV